MRTRLTTLVVTVMVLASACVFPLPAAGDPVPDLEATISQDRAAGTLGVSVTVADFDPSFVQIWTDGFVGPSAVTVTAEPWTAAIGVGALAAGPHRLIVLAVADGTIVLEQFDYELVGCNGLAVLCSRPYDQVRSVTTHNAMSSAADGWIGPNQTEDVPQQLAGGVRALMLDTHRAGDTNILGAVQVPGVDPDTAYLCHAICALGQQHLEEGLAEITAFLDANPDEVVTLIIESYLSHGLTAAAFSAAGLDQHAFVPIPGQPWPTLGQMVDADQRLVVLQDRAIDPAHPWLLDLWDHAFETDFDNAEPADFTCDPNRGSTANPLFILNHFLTDVFGSPMLAEQVNHDPLLGDRLAECEGVHAAVANFVTVDFADIGDVRAAVESLNTQ